jgi:hypothetical protein
MSASRIERPDCTMVVRRKKVILAFIVLLVLSFPTAAQRPYKELRPSSNYWDQTQRHVPVHITRLSGKRSLATVGDTLYMLDARNRVVWTWSTQGAPLTDLPIVDSNGTIYAIGGDLIWVALDSMTGKVMWRGIACGRDAYSQIGLYKGDVYFVVSDMEGYRDSISDGEIKDHLWICRGNSILWEADIPVRSRIEIEGNKFVAVRKRSGRILKKLIAVQHKFGTPMGKISGFSG